MSPYLLAGPAVALIGIVAVMFVMRHKSTEKRSMYSSRRSQIQRKVAAARSRTLAPHGRSSKAPTQSEIAAGPMAPATPAYEAPVAPRQAWEVGPATSAPAYAPPPAAPPAYTPPAAEPPPTPTFAPAPSTPPLEEPSWTPAPAEPAWTPGATPVPAAPVEPAAAPEPVSTPAGAGASWSIVGQDEVPATEERAPKAKDKKKGKQAAATATGSAWSLASGDSPDEEGDEVAVKAPNPAMAIAQYAVLVVGLVMVLIGVLVMVANSKVT